LRGSGGNVRREGWRGFLAGEDRRAQPDQGQDESEGGKKASGSQSA
jgi:hypothetical protein